MNKEHLRNLSKATAVAITSLGVLGSASDMYTHVIQNEQYPNRTFFKNPLLDQSIGNVGASYFLLVAIGTIGLHLQKHKNENLRKIGTVLPYATVTAGVFANVAYEMQFLPENASDMAMGGLAIIAGTITLKELNKPRELGHEKYLR